MALQRLNGEFLYGASLLNMSATTFGTGTAIAASTTRHHVIGCFNHPSRATKNISKIYFRFGAVTINSASVLRVSIQAISAAAGPPGRGDGTVIQSGNIAGSNGSFTSNTWFPGVTLGATYSATPGQRFAVVFELTTFNASDSVVINGITASATGIYAEGSSQYHVSEVGGVFTVNNLIPNILFECDDGSFGAFAGTMPCSALGSTTVNSGSTPDEYCMEFSVPFNCTICGAVAVTTAAAAGDFSIILYSGTTALQTESQDSTDQRSASSPGWTTVEFPETDLTANTTYRLAVRPDTATSITLPFLDVASASHFGAHPLETNFCTNSRTDAGAWGSPVTTRRYFILPKFSRIDDGAGGGGGMIQTRVQTGM